MDPAKLRNIQQRVNTAITDILSQDTSPTGLPGPNLSQEFRAFQMTPRLTLRKTSKTPARGSRSCSITVRVVPTSMTRITTRKRKRNEDQDRDALPEQPEISKAVKFDKGDGLEKMKQLIKDTFFIQGEFEMMRCLPMRQGLRLECIPNDLVSAHEIKLHLKRSSLYVRPIKTDEDISVEAAATTSEASTSNTTGTANTMQEEDISVEASEASTSNTSGTANTMQEESSIICPNCGCTVRDPVCLRCKQDEEYIKSLLTDQQKDHSRSRDIFSEEERLKVVRERQEFMMQQDEPDNDGICIKVRLPNRIVSRQFNVTDHIKILINFIGSHEECTRNFVVIPFGENYGLESDLEDTDDASTLLYNGISKSCTVNVQFIREDSTDDAATSNLPASVRHDETAAVINNQAANAMDEEDSTDEAAISNLPASVGHGETAAVANNQAANAMDEEDISDEAAASNMPDLVDDGPANTTEEEGTTILNVNRFTERIQEDLFMLESQLDEQSRKNLISVDRENILEGALMGFTRKKFNPKALLDVKFASEFGIDNGGPSREFLRLTVQAIRDSPMLQGEESNKSLVLNYAEELENYHTMGRIFAYSIVHRGPFPTFFSNVTYSYIAGLPLFPKLADIADWELRENLKEIDSSSMATFNQIINKHWDLVQLCGCESLARWHQKKRLLSSLLQHIVINRNIVALDKFVEGLNSLGLLEAIKRKPQEWQTVFVDSGRRVQLNAAVVEELFKPDFSDKGSNRRKKENKTHTYWRYFLEELEDEGGLGDLLIYATGANQIPLLGFIPTPSLEFKHSEDLAEEDKFLAEFPFANTCINILKLPLSPNYAQFKKIMNAAVQNVTTFTTA